MTGAGTTAAISITPAGWSFGRKMEVAMIIWHPPVTNVGVASGQLTSVTDPAHCGHDDRDGL